MVIKNYFIYLTVLLHYSTWFAAAQDSEQEPTRERSRSIHCPSRFSKLNNNGMDAQIQESLKSHCETYHINSDFIKKVDVLIKALEESRYIFNEVDENPFIPHKVSYSHILKSFISIRKTYEDLLSIINNYNPNALAVHKLYDSLLIEDSPSHLRGVYEMLRAISSLTSIYQKTYDSPLVETLSIKVRLEKLNKLNSILESHHSTLHKIIIEHKAFSRFTKDHLGNASPVSQDILFSQPDLNSTYEGLKALVQQYREKYSRYLEQE